ncbi:MAG: hypothetical protein EOP10_14675 [Proteobacteria bacterium]|nr:MAG: hypothetical protein EOP10_14675 [Pseudomonadota bacterium]
MRLGIRSIALSLAAFAAAQELRADSLEFYTLYRSPYYLGRGDTGVATADNHEAIFYNPAGLALGKGIYKETVLISPSVQVSTQTKDVARQVMVEKNNDAETFKNYAGKNIHFGLNNFTGVVFRRFALGGLVSSDLNVMLGKDADQNGLETIHADAAVNQVATLAAAESFFDESFLIGTTLKYIKRNEAMLEISAADASNIADKLDSDDVKQSREGYGVDLGMMLRPKSWPLSLGLHIENLGTTKLGSEEDGVSDKRLPQIVTAGFAVEKTTKTSSLSFQADFRDVLGAVEKNAFKRMHMGAEVRFLKFIGLTGGLNQGYPTMGFFANFYVVRMDIGIMTQEIGSSAGLRPDQRMMFRLMAGF